MGRVVVDVMPKPEILDPQGKAIAGALPRLGFTGFAGVRQGKRFELEVDGEVTAEVLAAAREAAATLLSNPVIEDVVRVEAVQPSDDHRRWADAGRGRHLPRLARRPGRRPRGPAGRRRGRSPSGTPTPTCTASTPWSSPAASPTATTCAAARSPGSRR